MYASSTDKYFSLHNSYFPAPFNFICFRVSPSFSIVLDNVANAGFSVGLRIEMGHPARRHKRLMQVTAFSAYGM